MSTIYEVIEQIVTVQEGLAITEPATVAVAKAWPFFPPASTTIAAGGGPVWMNEWTLVREIRDVSLRIEHYTVHMQLLVTDADLNRAAWIATAFMPKVIAAFDQRDEAGNGGVSLGGTVVNQTLRGGNPTEARLDRSDRSYMGLDLFLDVELHTPVIFS